MKLVLTKQEVMDAVQFWFNDRSIKKVQVTDVDAKVTPGWELNVTLEEKEADDGPA